MRGNPLIWKAETKTSNKTIETEMIKEIGENLSVKVIKRNEIALCKNKRQ